jgi:lipopolysaccharide export system protein LptA
MAQTAPPSTGDRVEILNADRWDFDQHVAPGAQRLIGHVRFKQADALMHCDSAYLYADQRVEAFGHVQVQQGDTLEITGDRLRYSGQDRTAVITGHVRLSDPDMVLTSDALRYDMREHRADYDSGARIVSARDGNTLTSMHGAYLAAEHRFIFSGNVRIEHPDRTITADTLHYFTTTGLARFFGPTHIIQGTTHMYCERGSYDTRAGRGRFTKAGRIISEDQTLTGDSLHYDREKGEGLGWGHVQVADTTNDMTVRGEFGRHLQQEGRSMITGRAELVMLMGKDSLFLHADTLFATQDSLHGRQVMARRNVRFFKSDLQGVCDTMTYSARDSLIVLRGTPFLWSNTDQINGDIVRIKMRNGHADRLFADGDAFLISRADSVHFDQVTGTDMTGFFRDDRLARLIAEGNCRTAYFARERKDGVEVTTGLNRADCSRIEVGLDSGKVSTVSFITQPDAVLYPLDKAPAEDLRLKGFVWNWAARPTGPEDIFRESPSADVAPGAGQ